MCPVYTGTVFISFIACPSPHWAVFLFFPLEKNPYVDADDLGNFLRYSVLLNAAAMCEHRWMLCDV